MIPPNNLVVNRNIKKAPTAFTVGAGALCGCSIGKKNSILLFQVSVKIKISQNFLEEFKNEFSQNLIKVSYKVS